MGNHHDFPWRILNEMCVCGCVCVTLLMCVFHVFWCIPVIINKFHLYDNIYWCRLFIQLWLLHFLFCFNALCVIICIHVTCWGNLPEILLNPADNDHEDDPYKMSARALCPPVSPTFEIRKKGTRSSNILLRLSHAEKYYDIKVKKVFILRLSCQCSWTETNMLALISL